MFYLVCISSSQNSGGLLTLAVLYFLIPELQYLDISSAAQKAGLFIFVSIQSHLFRLFRCHAQAIIVDEIKPLGF